MQTENELYPHQEADEKKLDLPEKMNPYTWFHILNGYVNNSITAENVNTLIALTCNNSVLREQQNINRAKDVKDFLDNFFAVQSKEMTFEKYYNEPDTKNIPTWFNDNYFYTKQQVYWLLKKMYLLDVEIVAQQTSNELAKVEELKSLFVKYDELLKKIIISDYDKRVSYQDYITFLSFLHPTRNGKEPETHFDNYTRDCNLEWLKGCKFDKVSRLSSHATKCKNILHVAILLTFLLVAILSLIMMTLALAALFASGPLLPLLVPLVAVALMPKVLIAITSLSTALAGVGIVGAGLEIKNVFSNCFFRSKQGDEAPEVEVNSWLVDSYR